MILLTQTEPGVRFKNQFKKDKKFINLYIFSMYEDVAQFHTFFWSVRVFFPFQAGKSMYSELKIFTSQQFLFSTIIAQNQRNNFINILFDLTTAWHRISQIIILYKILRFPSWQKEWIHL